MAAIKARNRRDILTRGLSTPASAVGGWTAAGDNEGYVGLELTDGTGTHYGWAHFIYNATNTRSQC